MPCFHVPSIIESFLRIPLYSAARAPAEILTFSPLRVTGPSFIPFAPWSGLSRVATRLSFSMTDKLKTIRSSIPLVAIFPSQEPVTDFLSIEF